MLQLIPTLLLFTRWLPKRCLYVHCRKVCRLKYESLFLIPACQKSNKSIIFCLWMLLFFSVVTTVPLFIMATLELLMIRRSLMEICGELIRWIFCLDFLALPSMSKFVFCYAVEWNDWRSGFTDSGLSRSPFSWVFGIVHGWGEKWLGRKGNDFNTD